MKSLALAVPAANGTGAAKTLQAHWATVACAGSTAAFDSGTVSLEVCYDGSRWLPAIDPTGDPIAFTAEGLKTVILGGEPQLRAKLAGSSGNTTATLTLHMGITPVRTAGAEIDYD